MIENRPCGRCTSAQRAVTSALWPLQKRLLRADWTVGPLGRRHDMTCPPTFHDMTWSFCDIPRWFPNGLHGIFPNGLLSPGWCWSSSVGWSASDWLAGWFPNGSWLNKPCGFNHQVLIWSSSVGWSASDWLAGWLVSNGFCDYQADLLVPEVPEVPDWSVRLISYR